MDALGDTDALRRTCRAQARTIRHALQELAVAEFPGDGGPLQTPADPVGRFHDGGPEGAAGDGGHLLDGFDVPEVPAP